MGASDILDEPESPGSQYSATVEEIHEANSTSEASRLLSEILASNPDGPPNDEQLRYLMLAQQVETARAISELTSAIRENKETQSQSLPQMPTLTPSRRTSLVTFDSTEALDEEEDVTDLDFDRKQVRLDGLEVYAVVSAITAGTLVDVYDEYNPGDIMDLLKEEKYLEVLMASIFMAVGIIGVVCGLHCIFVFSLVTMYGRTALGEF